MEHYAGRKNNTLQSGISQNQGSEVCTSTRFLTKENIMAQNSDNENILPYQNKKWETHFQDFVDFQRNHGGRARGNQSYGDGDRSIAHWVKRQRCQYKLFMRGKKSTMTKERIDRLSRIGFVWDHQEALWEQRYSEVAAYKSANGTCMVPQSSNVKLSNWVKCQRRQFQLFRKGLPSHITIERIRKLEKLGFEWNCWQESPLVLKASIEYNNEFYLEDDMPDITFSSLTSTTLSNLKNAAGLVTLATPSSKAKKEEISQEEDHEHALERELPEDCSVAMLPTLESPDCDPASRSTFERLWLDILSDLSD